MFGNQWTLPGSLQRLNVDRYSHFALLQELRVEGRAVKLPNSVVA